MTNEEAQRLRDQSRENDRLKLKKELGQSSADRADDIKKRNVERAEQKQSAIKILQSNPSVLQEIAKQGGSIGRRLEREIRRAEQTGRISSWLAGETIKEDASRKSAQQSGFSGITTTPLISALPPITISRNPYNSLLKKIDIKQQQDTQQPTCALSLFKKESSVWVSAGLIGGEVPDGFDQIDGKFIASSGSGIVSAKIVVDQNNGSISSRSVVRNSSQPPNTNTTFYYPLGYYSYSGSLSITNYGCGSVYVSLCRNWFAATSPFYGVVFSR